MTGSHKRVLVALPSLCAEGTPVLVLEMCRRWLAHGTEPTLVTLSDTPDDLLAEFLSLNVAIRLLPIPATGKRRYLDMVTGISALAHELRPHAFLSMICGWHAFLTAGAKWAGVPRTAAHVGNYPPYCAGLAFEKFRVLVQLGRPTTDKLICCSEYVKQGVEEHFRVPATALEVIYNGCPIEDVAARAERARTRRVESGVRIGMVARLEAHKDQPTLIRAAAVLAERGLDLEVQLIGDGSRRSEYEALIGSLGLSEKVRILGVRRDIPELLGGLDAFVFSAKPDEGLGVALIEAMAARVPIIAADVGACREVLDGGTLGLLVSGGQPESLASAIEHVLVNREQAMERAAQAQAKALVTFTIDAMTQAYSRSLGLDA